MNTDHWAGLREWVSDPRLKGIAATHELSRAVWRGLSHGDLPRWMHALKGLPASQPECEPDHAAPRLGRAVSDPEKLAEALMAFHPWRKGPLCLGGVTIDTEWRSDWKWARMAPHLELNGHRVLDVGCGNGYFGWRMLGDGAELVVGIDPTVLFVVQWLVQMHFVGDASDMSQRNLVLPLKDSQLPAPLTGFDTVFSMGVIYHRRDPLDHLRRLYACLRPGGQLVLETLVLDQPGVTVLKPAGRYARMRNVWFIPTVEALLDSLEAQGFGDASVLDVSATTIEEQRSTNWMQFQSLRECLDPDQSSKTVEGHPAPVRATVLARKRG